MADELKPCPICGREAFHEEPCPSPAASGGDGSGQRILRGLDDAIAFAQGDTSRGRIVHPQPKGGDVNVPGSADRDAETIAADAARAALKETDR